jgi:hypothetical protein
MTADSIRGTAKQTTEGKMSTVNFNQYELVACQENGNNAIAHLYMYKSVSRNPELPNSKYQPAACIRLYPCFGAGEGSSSLGLTNDFCLSIVGM